MNCISVFLFFFCTVSFSFAVSHQICLAHFLLSRFNGEKSELITFRCRKTTVSSKFFNRLRFQCYYCKSDIALTWSLEITLSDPLTLLFVTRRNLGELLEGKKASNLGFCIQRSEIWRGERSIRYWLRGTRCSLPVQDEVCQDKLSDKREY